MSRITISRIFKLGLVNFWRNRWLSLAASLMIMLTLLTMGVFSILNIFVNSAAEGIKDRIDMSVYFYENATEVQIKDIQYMLANRADVKKVKYISKEEALATWLQRTINSKVKNLINKDENPLPRSLQIQTIDPEKLESIANELSTPQYQPYIREISFQKTKNAIDRIVSMTRFIHRVGLVLSFFLLAISLVVILNTIRLTIFTRRDELEIMRLVGANAVFIRVPFTVEAILSGIAGSALAFLFVCILMYTFGPRLATSFSDTVSTTSPYYYLIQPYFEAATLGQRIGFWQTIINLWPLGLLQLAIGTIFSISCSMIAIRRYLRF